LVNCDTGWTANLSECEHIVVNIPSRTKRYMRSYSPGMTPRAKSDSPEMYNR